MLKRKVGRPKGSKNKTSKTTVLTREAKQKVVSNILDLHGDVASLNTKVANLEHQIIGYKALISYLEFQLGLKGSQ